MNQSEKDKLVQELSSLGFGKSEDELKDLLEKHNWNPDAAAGALFDSSNTTVDVDPQSGWANATTTNNNQNEGGWGTREGGWDGLQEMDTQASGSSWAGGEELQYPPERGRSMERGRSIIGALNASSSSLATFTPAEKAVIDLTNTDAEASNLHSSLNNGVEESTSTFGPSNRAPSVHWAVVPSNVRVEPSTEDQDMSRALQASLQEAYPEDVYEELPPEDQIRKGGRPVALRPPHAGECWAGLLIQVLYYLPQLRTRLMAWRTSKELESIATERELGQVSSLQQFFVLFDLAQMSYHTLPPETFDIKRAVPHGESHSAVDTLTNDLLEVLASNTEEVIFSDEISKEELWPRLFHLRSEGNGVPGSAPGFFPQVDRCRVDVEWTDDSSNDLIANLTSEHLLVEHPRRRTFIQIPSDIITFSIRRSQGISTKLEEPFKFPPYFYLDRFLASCADITESKIRGQWSMRDNMQALEDKLKNLTTFEDKDVVKALKSSLYYLEQVSETKEGEDPAKTEQKAKACLKLREIIADIEEKIQSIQSAVEKIKSESITVFDCPELQMSRYDLRAVLYQDGFFGRDHIYSYVKDYETGVWWKTLDHRVTEVAEETVLSDSTGLHIGGGPYMLFYTRALGGGESGNEMDQDRDWPESVKEDVRNANAAFREKLPPEMAAELEAQEAPSLGEALAKEDASQIVVDEQSNPQTGLVA